MASGGIYYAAKWPSQIAGALLLADSAGRILQYGLLNLKFLIKHSLASFSCHLRYVKQLFKKAKKIYSFFGF